MKKQTVLFSFSLFIALIAVYPLASLAEKSKPQPPPLPPLNLGQPTAQSATVESLTAFLPKIVARCGDHEYTKEEVIKLIRPGLQMAIARGQVPPAAQLKQIIRRQVEGMINQKLIFSLALADGFKPDLEAAKAELEKIKKNAGEEKIAGFLRMQGITEDKFLENLSQGRAVEKWVEEKIRPLAKVDKAAIATYYKDHPQEFTSPEQVHASHILIKVKPDADEKTKAAAKKKIEGIRDRLAKGEDFATLAKEFSEGPSSSRGGDLGTFGRHRMVPAFEKAAFALDPGKVSDIVKTRFGYHLIKVTEHTKGGLKPLNQSTRDQIRKKLSNKWISNYLKKKIDEAGKAAKMKIFI